MDGGAFHDVRVQKAAPCPRNSIKIKKTAIGIEVSQACDTSIKIRSDKEPEIHIGSNKQWHRARYLGVCDWCEAKSQQL